MNRDGQVAIFVIVGVMIAVAITYLFLIDRTPTTNRTQDFDNPESYIDDCLRQKSLESIDNILAHGGFPDSADNVLYKGVGISYLCKNINFYEPCVVQHPLYLREVENEIVKVVSDDVAQCFALLEQELIERNYLIDAGPLSLNVDVKPKITQFFVNKSLVISKGGDSRKYNSFDVFVSSPLYDMALITQEIVSQEARWCYFSNDGFMMLYNDFDIRRDSLGDSTKIYTIEHKKSGKKMTFAIRGCVIPNGF